VAVVSAGWQNSFSNPHPEVVARLEALGTRVVGTHAWGLVTVRSDGRRLELDTARWSSAPWRLQEPF
jgi:beta-lactamase superfamily II metal-dependent hydrolase